MFTKVEQRSWIRMEMARGRSTQESFQGLRKACVEAALPYRTVALWVKAFREGKALYWTIPRGEHSLNSLFPFWMLIAYGLRVS